MIHFFLFTRFSSAKLESNRRIHALYRASTAAMKVSTGAEALALLILSDRVQDDLRVNIFKIMMFITFSKVFIKDAANSLVNKSLAFVQIVLYKFSKYGK